MLERGADQADGLRRMFAGTRTRVLEIAAGAPGVGRTAVAVNLGAALARAGRSVLLVDFVGAHTDSGVHRYFGLQSSGVSLGAGLIVGRGYGVATLTHREAMQAGPLPSSAFGTAPWSGSERTLHDWVLVNGTLRDAPVVSDDGVRDVLLVLSPASSSLPHAYARIKRMAADGARCRFRVVVNRVSSQEAARRVFRNLAQVARGYLDIELEHAGFVPQEPALQLAAAQGAPLLDVDPACAAAQAFVRLADTLAVGTSIQTHRGGWRADSGFAAGAM